MQTHVYLRPSKKVLEPLPEPGTSTSINAIRKVTGATIRRADLHVVRVDVANPKPGRILDNDDAGYVDKARPVFIEF